MSIQITGVDAVIKSNGKATAKINFTIAEALVKCAEVLLAKSQKLVPVATEALKKSGRVEMNDKAGTGAAATVAYGGPTAPYAYIVHERMDIPHAAPTQARYLADAIPMVRGTMTSIIRRQLSVGTMGRI